MNMKLPDLLVAAVTMLLLASVSVLIAQQANEQDLRRRCADNLRKIAQGLAIYANDNRGEYPRTFAPPLGVDEKNEKLATFLVTPGGVAIKNHREFDGDRTRKQ